MLERKEKPITKEIYENALNNSGVLTEADKEKVFTQAEQMYGVYLPMARKKDGKYVVTYTTVRYL